MVRPIPPGSRLLALLVCAVTLLAARLLPAEEVSHEPPPIFRERLQAQLTPLEEVLQSTTAAILGDDDGIVLLDEEIHYFEDDGRRYIVRHVVRKPLDESGVKAVSEATTSCRKANQKIHFVSAQTVLPSGEHLSVQPGATLLRTPRRNDESDQLYEDLSELRIIFPNVMVGAVTEYTVVIEESQFRLPGEFMTSHSWIYGWPIGRKRLSVDLPGPIAGRLHAVPYGQGVPAGLAESLPDGRKRFVWERRDVAALPSEANRPPTAQAGPALWLTTLPDWNAFARWYAPLVEASSALGPALKKQIDEWTKAAGTPQETLELLVARAGREVRYTGLEFGEADLQPHDCNDVWANRYGDCKDKANLLRAILRHKGIPAWLALVNTDHLGRIEQRSPDYRQFNHAIVAVEPEPGRLVFCDPTLRFAKAGLLAPGDADRDVLLIKDATAVWVRTPPQDAGLLHYNLDLKLGADGGLSGWLTRESTDYYGVSDADYYSGLDRDRTRAEGRRMAQGFFKNAEIVDVDRTPLEQWDGTYRFKTYFLVPGDQEQAQRPALDFPQGNRLLPQLEEKQTRQTPYFLWRHRVQVTARIQFPEGLSPSALPHPYRLASPAVDSAAEWSFQGGVCEASYRLALLQQAIPTDEFEVFRNSILSLRNWLNRPLALTQAADLSPTALAPKFTLENFPIMPSGEGQLTLADQRFPEEGSSSLRREALAQVMQYFPTDAPTIFGAGVRLALLDRLEKKRKEAIERLRSLLQNAPPSVDRHDRAWARYILAVTLKDAGATAEALQLLAEIRADHSNYPSRRGWAALAQARLLAKTSPADAEAALRECLALDSDALPEALAMLAAMLVEQGRMPELQTEIRRLAAWKPPQLAEALTELAKQVGTLFPGPPAETGAELLRLLEEAGKTAELGSAFGEALKVSRETARSSALAARIRSQLLDYLAQNPLRALDAADAALSRREEFVHAVGLAVTEHQAARALRCAMEVLTRFEPDADFFDHLWKATSHADWNERASGLPEPLLPVLLDLSDELPHRTDAYIDCRLVRAKGCVRRSDQEAARRIHEALLGEPELSPGFKVVVHERLAENLERLRRYPEALTVYQAMEGELEFRSAKDALLRAAFLRLELGDRPEALRLLSLLAGHKPETLSQAETGAQLLELTALVKDAAAAGKYWQSASGWWPAWLALEEKLGWPPGDGGQIIPAIPNVAALGQEIAAALGTRDQQTVARDLRLLAHAARWQPSMAVELCTFVSLVPNLAPEHASELRDFGLRLADSFVSDDPALRRRLQFCTAVSAIDSNQNERALQEIRAFEGNTPPDDPLTHAMARLWALAASRLNQDHALAAAALEKALASPNFQDLRGPTVSLLADLYERAGRTEDAKGLLQKELADPRIAKNDGDQRRLSARLRQLGEGGIESTRRAHAVAAWIEKHKPAWFDLAEPKDLQDPRLGNLDEVLKRPGSLFIGPEIVKLGALVASSAEQPAERAREAFGTMLRELSALEPSAREAAQLAEGLLDEGTLPEAIRMDALYDLLSLACDGENRQEFTRLRALPLAAKLPEQTLRSVNEMDEALQVDRETPAALSTRCELLLQSELDPTTLEELRENFRRLLELEAFDTAALLSGKLAAARLSPGITVGRSVLQMQFLKMSSHARRWAPTGKAMREIVLTHYPAETILEPAEADRQQYRRSLGELPEAAAAAVQLWQIKTRRFSPSDFLFWKRLIRNLPTAQQSRLALDLVDAALREAPDDATRPAAVQFAMIVLDHDDPKLHADCARLFLPYRDAEKFPATYVAIRASELLHTLRLGAPLEIEAEFGRLHDPDAARYGRIASLTHSLATGDLAMLRKTLEAASPEELISGQNLLVSLPAFAAAGLTDELALARSAARKVLYEALLRVSSRPDPAEIGLAYRLARALHDPKAVPPDWFVDLDGRIQHRHTRAILRMEDALLREDWPRLLEAAESAIRDFPTFYYYYWLKGEALCRLGRSAEAAEPLRIYTRYSHDEMDYPRAQERLKEIGRSTGEQVAR